MVFLCPTATICQNPSAESPEANASVEKFIGGYPLVFYFPATKWGFGAAGIMTFQLDELALKNRSSQIQMGLVYTLNKQLLAYSSWKLFWNEDRYQSFGELGYYDYFYNFYGLGSKSQLAAEEAYFVTFPRVRLNFLKEIHSNVFLGLLYHFDSYNIHKLEPRGLLESLQIIGFSGGRTSSLGIVLQLDTRDNQFYPTGGNYIELKALINDELLGSDYGFQKIIVEASTFVGLSNNGVLGINVFLGSSSRGTPFYELMLLGGPRRARGYAVGRFSDYEMMVLQAEYRFTIYKRLGAATFVSAGDVFDLNKNIVPNVKYNIGAGLRFNINKKDHLNIRADLAFGAEEAQFYFTIGEAF